MSLTEIQLVGKERRGAGTWQIESCGRGCGHNRGMERHGPAPRSGDEMLVGGIDDA